MLRGECLVPSHPPQQTPLSFPHLTLPLAWETDSENVTLLEAGVAAFLTSVYRVHVYVHALRMVRNAQK